jgi:quercetin dioxygenase-like cupin family protein
MGDDRPAPPKIFRRHGRQDAEGVTDGAGSPAPRRRCGSIQRSQCHTVYGGHEHVLLQTLIALRAVTSLDEHENPGEATVQVLHGRVTLVAGENRWNGSPGDLMFIPDSRHALDALEDSVVLLTVAKRS